MNAEALICMEIGWKQDSSWHVGNGGRHFFCCTYIIYNNPWTRKKEEFACPTSRAFRSSPPLKILEALQTSLASSNHVYVSIS